MKRTKTIYVIIHTKGEFDRCEKILDVPWTFWPIMGKIMGYVGHDDVTLSEFEPVGIPDEEAITEVPWSSLLALSQLSLLARLCKGER